MGKTRATEGAGSIARAWRAEGFAGIRDRLWERIVDASIRARLVRGGREPWPAASILNVIGVPMTTAFGGVPLQLRARLRHESMTRPVAVLCREAGGIQPGAAQAVAAQQHGAGAVAAGGREGGVPGAAGWRLESWSGGRPRRAMTFPAGDWNGDPLADDPDWLRAVQTCVGLVNARAVHVENAAGLSLVSLSSLMGIGSSGFESRSNQPSHDRADRHASGVGASTAAPHLPVVLSVHDLSLFSRQPHGPGQTQTQAHAGAQRRLQVPTHARLQARKQPPAESDSHEAPVDDRQRFEHAFHHALGTGILRAAAFTIYPSQFMRHRIEALPHLPAHVVAPGIEPPARASRSARRPDQIALLGGGQEHKGGARLPRIAAALAARGLKVTSYGGYGHEHLLLMRGIAGVRVRGYYRAGTLPGLLARQGASVALILSAVPESFSLVLSEAWSAGVPVIAPATGAFVERFGGLAAARSDAGQPSGEGGAVHQGGVLIAADASDEEVLAAVERARSMTWDALPTPPTAAQAAERHIALYRDPGIIA